MIKNIIFDFGGVLLDLDYEKTWEELSTLTGIDFRPEQMPLWFTSLNDAFETGAISQETFLWHIQKQSLTGIPAVIDILKAWNRMLLGWKSEKFQFLMDTKKQYRTFLLSNTNDIHIDWVRRDLAINHGIEGFEQTYFERVYYSHLIGMRKPDAAIFRFVLGTNRLNPEETLFIDDSAEHILTAASLGLKVYHFERNSDLKGQWLKILSEHQITKTP